MQYMTTSLPAKMSLSELPKTFEEAVTAGSKTYFTGLPCKNGHLSKRHVSNKGCATCTVERRKRRRECPMFRAWDNARGVEYSKKWCKRNKKQHQAYHENYRATKLKIRKVEVREHKHEQVFTSVKEAAAFFGLHPVTVAKSIREDQAVSRQKRDGAMFKFTKRCYLAYKWE